RRPGRRRGPAVGAAPRRNAMDRQTGFDLDTDSALELDDVAIDDEEEARASDSVPAPVQAAGLPDGVPATSRKIRRRGRRTRIRSKTIAMKRLTKEEMRLGALMYPPVDDEPRPQTRKDCKDAQRPCPWVSCKHHLYLDVNP